MDKKGTVYLVGSGPGGMSLMTRREREVQDMAEVILYDQVPGEVMRQTLRTSLRKHGVSPEIS